MRARYSTSRDMQDLCIAARRAGWRIEQTGGDHIRLTAPNGEFGIRTSDAVQVPVPNWAICTWLPAPMVTSCS